MSADSWKRCPVCRNRPSEYRDGIDHLYGKIPQAEFSKLSEELKNLQDTETVRLDYEVTIEDNGSMLIWVMAKCITCGAEWKFAKKCIKHRCGVGEP